jgi:hypothetical protein
MATGVQLVKGLNTRQRVMSAKLGVTLAQMPAEPRAVLQLSNVSLVAVVKLLVAKGVFTEAELAAAFDDADGWAIPPEKPMPENPDEPAP